MVLVILAQGGVQSQSAQSTEYGVQYIRGDIEGTNVWGPCSWTRGSDPPIWSWEYPCKWPLVLVLVCDC